MDGVGSSSSMMAMMAMKIVGHLLFDVFYGLLAGIRRSQPLNLANILSILPVRFSFDNALYISPSGSR